MRTSSIAGVRLEKIPESSLSVHKGTTKAFSVEPLDRTNNNQSGRTMVDTTFPMPQLKNHKISKQE